MKFELELQDISASVDPRPRLKLITRWTPKQPAQPVVPSQGESHLILRYPSLQLVYLPGPHEIGVAQLDLEGTENSPSWYVATGLHQKTVKFSLVVDFSLLEKVEQARKGSDFVLGIIPHGEVEEIGYLHAGQVNSYWLEQAFINLDFPRSRWGDILEVLGYPKVSTPPELPLSTPASKAAQVHLQEAVRQLNLDNVEGAIVNARTALEELGTAIPPLRPRPTDGDYRKEDPATRIRRTAWATRHVCNITAHKEGARVYGRAEALLAIQEVGALIAYVGAEPGTRKVSIPPGPAIGPAALDSDYTDHPEPPTDSRS